MLKFECGVGTMYTLLLLCLLSVDSQQSLLMPATGGMLSSVSGGGDCKDCRKYYSTCMTNKPCQQYDIAGYWYYATATLAMDEHCIDKAAGQWGSTTCKSDTPKACFKNYLCAEGCASCVQAGDATVDTNCDLTGGEVCLAGEG